MSAQIRTKYTHVCDFSGSFFSQSQNMYESGVGARGRGTEMGRERGRKKVEEAELFGLGFFFFSSIFP